MSLAVEYRPKTFSEVSGQHYVINILENQIKSKSIGRAYLFSGGSGTGKTTVARIFANEIKAEIIEIDAASNNGVDNIRQLNETASFKPLYNDYKLFIIDECHMLSTSAWNALLKTLEDTPSYVIFILATTEPQKIPKTIISRVQTFNFTPLSLKEIKDRLNHLIILKYPKVQLEEGIVDYISKLAGGGMRLAITMLETCIGVGTDLTIASVTAILGQMPTQYFIDLVGKLWEEDKAGVITNLVALDIKGVDFKLFTFEFLTHILDIKKFILTRDATLCKFNLTLLEDIKNQLNDFMDSLEGETGNKLDIIMQRLDKYYKVVYTVYTQWKNTPELRILLEGQLLTMLEGDKK